MTKLTLLNHSIDPSAFNRPSEEEVFDVYRERFMKLFLAMNTQSQRDRSDAASELLDFYAHMLSVEDREYIRGEFEKRAVRASTVGKIVGAKGYAPKKREKGVFTKPKLLLAKFDTSCMQCTRQLTKTEDHMIIFNSERYCVVCGVEEYPEVLETEDYRNYQRAFQRRNSEQ